MITGDPSGMCPVWREGRIVVTENVHWDLTSNKGHTWTPEVIAQWRCPVVHFWWSPPALSHLPGESACLLARSEDKLLQTKKPAVAQASVSALGVWITAGTSALEMHIKLSSWSQFSFYLFFPLECCLLVFVYLHVGAVMAAVDNCCCYYGWWNTH